MIHPERLEPTSNMVIAPRCPTEDRRGSPRLRLVASLKLQHPAPLHPARLDATLVDVSPLGLSLDVEGTPVSGAQLLLEIAGADGIPLELPARIVRVQPLSENVSRVGCELPGELTRRDYAALRARLSTQQ